MGISYSESIIDLSKSKSNQNMGLAQFYFIFTGHY